MLLTIIDVETTGLEDDAEVIEIAAVLFDTESMAVIQQLSTLIKPSIPNGAEIKNKISESALKIAEELEVFANSIIDTIFQLADISDFVIAHNAEFDKKFLPEIKQQWLCTHRDFRFEKATNGSLLHLANDYGVPIVNNHRALSDCLLIVEIFRKHSAEELEALINFAAEPNITLEAQCSYAEKDLAKNAGFQWNRIIPKKWAKVVKRSEYQDVLEICNFSVKIADVA